MLELTLTQHLIPSMKAGVATEKIMALSLPRTVEMVHNYIYSVLDEEILHVLHIILSGQVVRGRNEETPCCASVIIQAKP